MPAASAIQLRADLPRHASTPEGLRLLISETTSLLLSQLLRAVLKELADLGAGLNGAEGIESKCDTVPVVGSIACILHSNPAAGEGQLYEAHFVLLHFKVTTNQTLSRRLQDKTCIMQRLELHAWAWVYAAS